MENRRRFLQRSLALPMIAGPTNPRVDIAQRSRIEILSRSCCLSQESAAGYELVLSSLTNAPGSAWQVRSRDLREIVVATGLRGLSDSDLRQLRSRVTAGAWLIWERPASFADRTLGEYDERFAEIFGVEARLRAAPVGALYVRYHWPEAMLVRRMGALPRFSHPIAQAIATCEGEACGFRQALGKGGFVYLGSMLGPQLSADDKHAKTLLTRLLREI